ncbi:hypothetical protein NQ315_001390 [Exocentrus adspersus]|uniref:Fibronectin type III domain protein n=1 Tax=Exocentrus adspersus TaxID=1586481 RepID=A0AAV8WFA5_9CUCU|nr:hypothetical protein NQ315_001390 [Exocentrus adspersus]
MSFSVHATTADAGVRAMKLSVGVPLLFWCWYLVAAQEICVPNPVGGVELASSGVLRWDASTNCPNTIYRVQIDLSGQKLYEIVVAALNYNVAFLLYCQTYTFFVIPIASNVIGAENYVTAVIPIPEGANIAINGLRGAQIDDDVLIQWQVGSQYPHCVDYFNLFIYDDDDDEAEVPKHLQVTQPGYLLQRVAKCSKYRFEVSSSYGGVNGTTERIEYSIPPAVNTPSLGEVRQNAISINTTWNLEKYHVNRCRVTSLLVTGTRFNATYPIEDTPERPNVQVSITGLRADSMYYFSVSTENSAGLSAPYQMAVQTLPIQSSPGVDIQI